jgi:hypothetical protein
MGTISSTTAPDDGRLARGRARMREIAHEDKAACRELLDRLVGDLGRPATQLELYTLEQIAARMVRSRRLRSLGRDDREEARLIAQLLRAAGIRQVKPAEPPVPSPLERWRAKQAQADKPAEAPTSGTAL